MKNGYLPEGILRVMETLAEATRPYQAAVDVLKQNTELFVTFSDPLVNKLFVMDSAMTKGLFDEKLTRSISGLLVPYHEFASAQTTITALGSSFEGMLKPEVYASVNTMATTVTKIAQPAENIQAAQSVLEPLIRATEIVDTTWLKDSRAWLVEQSILSDLDVGKLSSFSSAVSRLCTLEHETSLLANIPETLTSATTQIASIIAALDKELPKGWKYEEQLSTSTLISDYCGLATRQHELLKKASNIDEVSWRLGILDAASVFVDRQVGWYLSFADAIACEKISASEEDVLETESTALSLIPIHLGLHTPD